MTEDKYCTSCRHLIDMTEFREEIDKAEFEISGTCQKCIDIAFPPSKLDKISAGAFDEVEEYIIDENDVVREPYTIPSVLGRMKYLTFNLHTDDNGDFWLYAECENAGDTIFVHKSPYNGFNGQIKKFTLVNGFNFEIKGPVFITSEYLKKETGIDLTNKHLTTVIVSSDIDMNVNRTILKNILYKDAVPTVGNFYRGKEIAQKIADERNEKVSVYIEGETGLFTDFIYPKNN